MHKKLSWKVSSATPFVCMYVCVVVSIGGSSSLTTAENSEMISQQQKDESS